MIKEGMTPVKFTENPNILRQKDLDARWTKKNNTSYYGYKNHIKIDSGSKIITKYKVTSASIHDSKEILDLITPEDKGQALYADSAYVGEDLHDKLTAKEVMIEIHEKGYKNNPLNEEQKASNKVKSITRVRVEHIFGFMENSMNGMDIKRANANIG